MANILVTGAAGFIGYHVCSHLLDRGDRVIGLDNLNDYYDVRLKVDRLQRLESHDAFQFHKLDIADSEAIDRLFAAEKPQRVVHLAAQAGVRYSLQNPRAYGESNLVGFLNILEGCRQAHVAHLVFASSSSVYGANSKLPFSVHDAVDHPVSLYAATKRSNELMAHSYSTLFGLPTTGLRFFTVYGPWGRPDMAIFSFTKAILAGRAIDVYNAGQMRRDFTYIDDIVEGTLRTLDRPPEPGGSPSSPASSVAPFRLYNIGHNQPVELLHVIRLLERALNVKATLRMLPMQPGDVPATYADIDELSRDVGFQPVTSIEEGIQRFVFWYQEYYHRSGTGRQAA